MTRSENSALFGVVRESADLALSLAASAILIFGPLPIAGPLEPESKIQAPRSTILAIERSNSRYIPHLEFNAAIMPGTPAPGSENTDGFQDRRPCTRHDQTWGRAEHRGLSAILDPMRGETARIKFPHRPPAARILGRRRWHVGRTP